MSTWPIQSTRWQGYQPDHPGEIGVHCCSPDHIMNNEICLPLTVRPSTDEAAHLTAQVTQRSEPTLPQYKPQLCTFPTTTVPNTAEIIKAEPTARNTTQRLVFCTETWWQRWTSSSSDRSTRSVQKEKRLSRKVIYSVQCWSVSERIGAATEVSRALTKDLKWLKPQEEKESGFKQRTLDTQEPNT